MAVEKYLELFEKRTTKSRQHWEEAKRYLAGGVSGGAGFLRPHPVYIADAKGSKFVDIDGNEYIDLLLGGFPNILGHSPSVITEAVKKQLDHGTAVGISTELQIKLAKKINKYMPHIELVRFVNTGSEANLFACRVARSWTGKDKIAKFEGGYNGQYDEQLISGISGRTLGSADRPEPVADCAGIPKFVLDNAIILPYNNPDATVSIIKEHANELAAVLIEPVAGFGMGGIPVEKEFMKALRKITEGNNVLLIFDEVVTAFRVGGLGGAVKYYGVKPDLASFGKPVGGGMSIGAYGGRRDIMEKCVSPTVDPLQDAEYKIFQSGTFTGNPITMTAGLACLTELAGKDYSYIDNLAEKVRVGLRRIAAEQGFAVQITGMASMFCVHFTSYPISDQRTHNKADKAKNYEFSLGMIVNGVWLAPMHTAAICFAHTAKEIDYILNVAESVLKEMKR